MPATLRSIARTPESHRWRRALLTAVRARRCGRQLHADVPERKPLGYAGHENPVLDSTEIWSFVNLCWRCSSGTLAPGAFPGAGRRPFDVFAYNADKSLVYTGTCRAARRQRSWDGKTQCAPIRGWLRASLSSLKVTQGRYVWHCHLLEHEDNEMMRPTMSFCQPG